MKTEAFVVGLVLGIALALPAGILLSETLEQILPPPAQQQLWDMQEAIRRFVFPVEGRRWRTGGAVPC